MPFLWSKPFWCIHPLWFDRDMQHYTQWSQKWWSHLSGLLLIRSLLLWSIRKVCIQLGMSSGGCVRSGTTYWAWRSLVPSCEMSHSRDPIQTACHDLKPPFKLSVNIAHNKCQTVFHLRQACTTDHRRNCQQRSMLTS